MESLRKDFPFIVNHPDVAYFDNAATALKPYSVIEAVTYYYENLSANVHRGDYEQSLQTSAAYEGTREKLALFLNVEAETIVFTAGTSESLNTVAFGLADQLQAGDVILLNEAEHASNVLPWFEVARRTGAVIEYIPLAEDGSMSLADIETSLHEKVKVVAMAHVSNVLGYLNDIEAIAKRVHDHHALLVVDGAQSAGHVSVDLKALDVDFFAFSGHKMLGPSGVGVLYGKKQLLENLNPLIHGGGSNVRFNACGDVVLKESPAKFEAGTPNIEGVLGLGAAVDYVQRVSVNAIHQHVSQLTRFLIQELLKMEHITVYNPDSELGIVMIAVKGIFAHDVAVYLGHQNVSVRSGEHCARLLNGALHHEKSVRISLYFYNTRSEVEHVIAVLKTITLEKCIAYYV